MKRSLILTLLLLLLMSVPSVFASCAERRSDCETETDVESVATELEFAEPELTRLPLNVDLLNDRWYRRVNGRVDVFNAPDGQVVRVIEEGFNFVTILSDENGWTRINTDEYIRSEHLQDINWGISQFTGVLLPEEGLEYTLAFTLINLYPSLEAGGDPRESNGLMYRYTPVYIYDIETVDNEDWYLIGENKWVHQYHVAKVQPLENIPETVDTELWVGIDLYEQIVIAYEGATPIFATLISTGLDRWPTYEGTFHIYYRNPREFMTWGTVGDDYYQLEEVPWTMFFDEGRALHGAYWHDGLGYRRSHGCVNMSITDARWMYEWVAEHMGKHRSADVEEGPAVHVYSSGEYNL
jgi:hypothetical protein